jgi:flavin reductase (DIM6/NTAB) family NADH-FMN oxidoreductase RutF
MEVRQQIDEQAFQYMPIDAREFRRVLGRFASGVTVVTTALEGQVHGMTANAFVSVSLDPPLVLVSIDNRARMREWLQHSRRYAVNILAREQEAVAQHFAGRPQSQPCFSFTWKEGLPLLDKALAHLLCRVVDMHPAGDHTLYIGLVEALEAHDGQPLLFYTGGYRCLEVQLHEPWIW